MALRLAELSPLSCAAVSACSWLPDSSPTWAADRLLSVAVDTAVSCAPVSPPSWVADSDCSCAADRWFSPGADSAPTGLAVSELIWPALRFAAAVARPPSWALVRRERLMALKLSALSPLSCAAPSPCTCAVVSRRSAWTRTC